MSAAKRGPGRPPFAEGTARTVVFTMKLSEEERTAFDAAAAHAGKPVTQWAREALVIAARTTPAT